MKLSEALYADKRELELGLAWSWGRLENDRFRERLIALICEIHHLIRASVPILERARARLPADHPLALWFAEHEDEERGHDAWVLDDLLRLGADPERVRAALPLRETLAIAGSALYLIDLRGPDAALGYMHALEGSGLRPEDVDALAARAVVAPEALSAFSRHAAIDPSVHVVALDARIEAHATDPRLVRHAHRCALEGFTELYLTIARWSPEALAARLAELGVAPS